MTEVSEGIFWFPGNRISHCYFIYNGASFDIVDTGFTSNRISIDLELKRRGLSLINCLLTHSHADHAGNALFLRENHHTRVFASRSEIPFLEGTQSLSVRDYSGCNPFCRIIQFGDRMSPHPQVDEPYAFEDNLDYLDNYEFFPIPGHTPGSTGILHKPTKSLFLGDALLNCRATHLRQKKGLTLPVEFFCEDHDLALKSLLILSQIDFENAYFGHGNPILGSAKKEIMGFLNLEGIL